MKLHYASVLCLCSVLLIPVNSTLHIQGYFTTSFRLPSVSFIFNRVGGFLRAPFVRPSPQNQYYEGLDGHSQYPREFGGWSDISSPPQEYKKIRHHPQPYSLHVEDFPDFHDVTHPHHPVDFHGWGWSKPKQKESTCQPVRDREIRGPQDFEANWRLVRVNRNRTQDEVDPNSVLDPPQEPIPTPFPSIIAGEPSPFKSEFQQTIKFNLLDSSVDVTNVTENGDNDDSNSFSTTTAIPPTTALKGSNEIEGTLTIYRLPRLSAPIRGKYDVKKHFEEGLDNSVKARSRNETSSPIQNFMESDLRFMEDLFKRLKDLKSPPEATQSEESLVEMPQVISRVERRLIPEPNHSERTVLDFEFNFGLPVVSYDFESPSEIMEEVKLRKRRRFMKAERRTLMSSQRFRDFVGDEIRRDLSRQRRIGRNVFVAAEVRVQESYSINQYIICTTDKCDDCKIDPILSRNQFVDYHNGKRNRPFRSEDPRRPAAIKS